MKKIIFLLAAAASVLLSGCAQDILDLQPGKPADLTPQELIRKMERANDPMGLLKQATGFIMKQQIVSTEPGKKTVYSQEIIFKMPDKMRQTNFRNGKAKSMLFSRDGNVWYVNPDNCRAEEVTGHEKKLVHIFLKMLKPGHNYLQIFKDVRVDTVLDDETEQQYYRLICTAEEKSVAPYVFYVNPKTFLTDKCETIVYGSDGTGALYIAHSENYEWKHGVLLPQKSFIKVKGKTDISTITDYQLNPEIPDKTFDLPKAWTH